MQAVPNGLYDTYRLYFHKHVGCLSEADRASIFALLEILIAARQPPRLDELQLWLGHAYVERDLLPKLGSLFYVRDAQVRLSPAPEAMHAF